MKNFTVTHPKARSPLTIKGKTLEEALEKEGLDPNIWKEMGAPAEREAVDLGDNQRNGRHEDN